MFWFNAATAMFGDTHPLFVSMVYTTIIITDCVTATMYRSRDINISQWLQSWAHRRVITIAEKIWKHAQRISTSLRKNSPMNFSRHDNDRSRRIDSRSKQRKIGIRCNHTLAIATVVPIEHVNAVSASNHRWDSFTTPIAFTSLYDRAQQPTAFDSDSFVIAVDNCATRSITNDPSDFVKIPQKIKTSSIRGINGSIQVLRQGTIKWNICDDEGKTHELLLPNSFYAPKAPMRLLSPQHWAQSLAVAQGTQDATCVTTAKNIQLKWNTFTRTIPLDLRTNIGLLTSSPSYRKSNAFLNAHEDNPTPICLRAQVRIHDNPPDDEGPIDTTQTLRTINKVTFAPEVEEHQQLKLRYAIGELDEPPDATAIFEKDSEESTTFRR